MISVVKNTVKFILYFRYNMTQSNHPIQIEALFQTATTRLASSLPDINKVSKEHAAAMIRRYGAGIYGNFIPWMTACLLSVKSSTAYNAVAENLQVETKDNHPGLLFDFIAQVSCHPQPEDYTTIAPLAQEIQTVVSDGNGLALTTLLGSMESTSAVFIPYLMKLAKMQQDTEFIYLTIHGEADIWHAEQFISAIKSEASQNYPDPLTTITTMIDLNHRFFSRIFSY